MNPQQQQQSNTRNNEEDDIDTQNIIDARSTRLRRLILITSFFAFYLTAALLANEHEEPSSSDGVPIAPSSSPIPRLVCTIIKYDVSINHVSIISPFFSHLNTLSSFSIGSTKGAFC